MNQDGLPFSPTPPVPATPSDPDRTPKAILIGFWLALAVLWFFPSVLMNAYVLAGIDFPEGSTIGGLWGGGAGLAIYGTMVVAPTVAIIGVALDKIGYGAIMAILAMPAVVQAAAFIGYLILIDRYGAVCC